MLLLLLLAKDCPSSSSTPPPPCRLTRGCNPLPRFACDASPLDFSNRFKLASSCSTDQALPTLLLCKSQGCPVLTALTGHGSLKGVVSLRQCVNAVCRYRRLRKNQWQPKHNTPRSTAPLGAIAALQQYLNLFKIITVSRTQPQDRNGEIIILWVEAGRGMCGTRVVIQRLRTATF
jgi:hypothetical protein